ncbi:MAG: DUF58 domain-containing protein [Planctomycetaceae bacterium]
MMLYVAGAIILLIVASLLNLGLLVYAMYVVLALLAISRLLTKTWGEGLIAQRRASNTKVKLGDTVSMLITLENQGKLSVPWVLAEDVIAPAARMFRPPALELLGKSIMICSLEAREKKTMLYQIRCNRRGYFRIGPLVLETGDLFGLDRQYRVATEPIFLMVMPKVVELAGYDIASRRMMGEVRVAMQLYEDPTRISGIREYQLGDSLRRVHWPASARTGSLHSKVFEPSTIAGATLVLEFHKDFFPVSHEPVRSDLLVTAAASIANGLYQLGQQVGLVTNGRDAAERYHSETLEKKAAEKRVENRRLAQETALEELKNERLRPIQVPTQKGPETQQQIMETLARLELNEGLPFERLVLEVAGRMPRDATLLVFLPGGSVRHALALGNLRRRGFAVTVILAVYEIYDFAEASVPFLAEGIETRHLRDEDSIREICQEVALSR